MRKYLSILIILVFLFPISVWADANDNVRGWAWGDAPQTVPPEMLGPGWISFNCDNPELPAPQCAGLNDYGVNIDSSTGNFSGYAWSENIGWISFDRTETGTPPSSPYNGSETFIAKVALDTGEVTGWARAMAYDGGWDGWIKLRCYGTECTTADYGVSIDTGTGVFKGYAWGDTVVGWISFNDEDLTGSPGPIDYQVTTTPDIFIQAPYVEDGSAQLDGSQAYCRISKKTGQVSFKWTYKDADGDDQSQYHLQVATDSGFSNKIVDCIISQTVDIDAPPNNSGTGTSAVKVVPSPSTDCTAVKLEIAYNDTYWWQVKVRECTNPPTCTEGEWSLDWEEGSINFTTEPNAYPWPEFTANPQEPSVDEIIQFCSIYEEIIVDEETIIIICPIEDLTFCYDASNNPITCSTWSWNFGDGSPLSSNKSPNHSYSSSGAYNVTLTVSDGTYSCISDPLSIIIGLPLPEWKEITPFGLFDNFLAMISKSFSPLFRGI